MVRPAAWGTAVQMIRAAVVQLTPFARSFSRCSMTGGRTSRNVRISNDSRKGGMTSRMM
jgi:hypothetical protein